MTRSYPLAVLAQHSRRLKHAASLRWLTWLRQLGLKPSSPNLIMVDFAHRDPRSVSDWLRAREDHGHQATQYVWQEMLAEPLLSDQDIQQCLGRDATEVINQVEAESMDGTSS